jgi:hypothetical protein
MAILRPFRVSMASYTAILEGLRLMTRRGVYAWVETASTHRSFRVAGMDTWRAAVAVA